MRADTDLHNLGVAFAQIAARSGAAPAIRAMSGPDVSYAALDALTNQLARWLSAKGIGRGAVVGLAGSKTPAGYGLMLACLRIGAAYTHLDDQNPPERLARIFSVCRPRSIVCDEAPAPSIVEAAARCGVPVASLPEHMAEIEALDPDPLTDLPAVAETDAAYVMFTSGSSGVPKGAAISHSSVLNFIAWARSTFGIGPGDVVANLNPLYFDNSVFDFYSSLFTGAGLAPITRADLVDPRATVRKVDAAGCTVWFSVPSLLIYLMTMKALRPDTFQRVRTIIFGGEGYPKSELSKLFKLYGRRCRLYNVYGPTECTCICSAYRIAGGDLIGAGLPPLGRIAEIFSYLVLNADAAVAPGEVGELCLMGPQVGLGYYNDPERTNAAFVPNPLAPALMQRMYRSGDLVREVDGLLHFVGRKDNQIKHMGYRIELEEIEAAINCLAYAIQTAVIYKRVRDSFGHIIAYIATTDPTVNDDRLRADLKAVLPPYMMPSRFVISDELPKNANGKVDRASLKEL